MLNLVLQRLQGYILGDIFGLVMGGGRVKFSWELAGTGRVLGLGGFGLGVALSTLSGAGRLSTSGGGAV